MLLARTLLARHIPGHRISASVWSGGEKRERLDEAAKRVWLDDGHFLFSSISFPFEFPFPPLPHSPVMEVWLIDDNLTLRQGKAGWTGSSGFPEWR